MLLVTRKAGLPRRRCLEPDRGDARGGSSRCLIFAVDFAGTFKGSALGGVSFGSDLWVGV